MYPIVRKETLADNIILMDIKAPRVAKECLPGQFIIAKTDEVGERIPLTICDYDRVKETVTIVVQTIGAGWECRNTWSGPPSAWCCVRHSIRRRHWRHRTTSQTDRRHTGPAQHTGAGTHR